jgi:glycosyltransferase involved in cell wall biosynthesis
VAPTAEPGSGSVLHVIHRLGSGVETVVLDYARALPQLDHHVFFSPDESCHDPAWADSPEFASATRVDTGMGSFLLKLRSAHRDIRPDLVHAHSSVAGGCTRSVLPGARVVYTPHCFAFLRADRGPLARAGYRGVERVLAPRTRALAACSPHEAELGRRLMPADRVHYVPNVADVDGVRDAGRAPASTAVGTGFHIVMSGRVAAQKGVSDFASMAVQLRRQQEDVRCTWIGGGDESLTRQLREAGVDVTGWLPRLEGLATLATADLYVHSALWEAAPMTVLEASQLDVPVLARDSEPLRALGLTPLWSSVSDLVDMVGELRSGEGLERLRRANDRLRSEHTPSAQRAALAECYVQAMSSVS